MKLEPFRFNKEPNKPEKTKRFIIINNEKVYITPENMREVGRMALESIKHRATEEKVNDFIKHF